MKIRKKGLSPRVLAICAMLAAMSIVCGKFLAIPLGDVIRVSFENLPILLSSLMFGPIIGAITAVAADIFGCILRGYALNPLITVGAAALAVTSGVIFKLMSKTNKFARLAIGTVVAHLIGSVVIKTFGLAAFYAMPFGTLLLWRALNYLIVIAMDLTALIIITKNKYVASIIGDTQALK